MSTVPQEVICSYQVPRTSETYVHRSGRTARATKEGLCMLLVSPDDMMNFKKICKSLGKDEELPTFPIETRCMDAIMVRSISIRACPFLMLKGLTDITWVLPQERVNLARRIEKVEYYNSKEKHHNSWLKQAAEALEVDLDDDLLLGKTSTF